MFKNLIYNFMILIKTKPLKYSDDGVEVSGK